MSITKKTVAKNEYIKKLSQQHHFNLVFCWKVRQGLKRQIPLIRVYNYVRYFWQGYLQYHFLAEEVIMAPFLNDRQVMKVIKEHKKIEKQVERLPAYSERNLRLEISEFVEMLYEHIHYEERSLYPRLEKQITEAQVQVVVKRVAKVGQYDFEDQYEDPFWNN
jgi:hemerythrin-like domain-containing protein